MLLQESWLKHFLSQWESVMKLARELVLKQNLKKKRQKQKRGKKNFLFKGRETATAGTADS